MGDSGGEQRELTISLWRGDTSDPACTELADRLYTKFMAPHPRQQWRGAYQDGCSIIVLPDAFETYWQGAAGYGTGRMVRNRKAGVRKALAEGYSFARIDRNSYLDDVHEINTSLPNRQGRPMDEAYLRRPSLQSSRVYTCPRHQIVHYGVLQEGKLVAYAWVYQVGEMCLFSTILGHGAHLRAGVMYLLIAESIRDRIEVAQTRFAMYGLHASGTPGLTFFKEQMGFRPSWVNWQQRDEPVTRPMAPGLPAIVPPPDPSRRERTATPRPRLVRAFRKFVRKLTGRGIGRR